MLKTLKRAALAALLLCAATSARALPTSPAYTPLPVPDPTTELAQLRTSCVQLGQQLDEALVPCLQVIGTCALQLWIIWCGFELAFLGGRSGRSLASVFVEITMLGAILYAVCIAMWPQTLLGNLRAALLPPAIALGQQMVATVGVSGESPTQWIMSWIVGMPVTSGVPVDFIGNPASKFSMQYIQDVLWQCPGGAAALAGQGEQQGDLLQKIADSQSAQSVARWIAFLMGLGAIFAGLITAFLTAAVAVFTSALTQLFVLGGAELAWDLYVPLGMVLVPLIYLRGGRAYWIHYLVVLVALAILPALYWLMSAIGTVVMVDLFNAIFGASSGSVGAFIRGAVRWATVGAVTGLWAQVAQTMGVSGANPAVRTAVDFMSYLWNISGYYAAT